MFEKLMKLIQVAPQAYREITSIYESVKGDINLRDQATLEQRLNEMAGKNDARHARLNKKFDDIIGDND